jgi:hypothetical protein
LKLTQSAIAAAGDVEMAVSRCGDEASHAPPAPDICLIAFPWYAKLFGGRQSARSIHFLTMLTLDLVSKNSDPMPPGPIPSTDRAAPL